MQIKGGDRRAYFKNSARYGAVLVFRPPGRKDPTSATPTPMADARRRPDPTPDRTPGRTPEPTPYRPPCPGSPTGTATPHDPDPGQLPRDAGDVPEGPPWETPVRPRSTLPPSARFRATSAGPGRLCSGSTLPSPPRAPGFPRFPWYPRGFRSTSADFPEGRASGIPTTATLDAADVPRTSRCLPRVGGSREAHARRCRLRRGFRSTSAGPVEDFREEFPRVARREFGHN
jgi:hypothetical protein